MGRRQGEGRERKGKAVPRTAEGRRRREPRFGAWLRIGLEAISGFRGLEEIGGSLDGRVEEDVMPRWYVRLTGA